MTTARKDPPKSKPAVFKWEPGRTYICIKATSPGYREGETYTAYRNDNGHTCLRGRDGYEDMCSMLVSDFRVAR